MWKISINWRVTAVLVGIEEKVIILEVKEVPHQKWWGTDKELTIQTYQTYTDEVLDLIDLLDGIYLSVILEGRQPIYHIYGSVTHLMDFCLQIKKTNHPLLQHNKIKIKWMCKVFQYPHPNKDKEGVYFRIASISWVPSPQTNNSSDDIWRKKNRQKHRSL